MGDENDRDEDAELRDRQDDMGEEGVVAAGQNPVFSNVKKKAG